VFKKGTLGDLRDQVAALHNINSTATNHRVHSEQWNWVSTPGLSGTIYVHFPCISRTVEPSGYWTSQIYI